MFKKIIYIYIYTVLVWWLMYLIELKPIFLINNWIINSNYKFYLFIPIIIFTILLYFWEKIKDEKKSMYFAVFTFIFSLISWIWFYFYTGSNF